MPEHDANRKPQPGSSSSGANQGEGNRDAARAYDRDQKAFAESGKVEPAARDAERALNTPEAKELKEAERIGKRHAHGEDPALKR